MPNQNCPQIKKQYENLLNLKKEFEDSSDLADRERLMKELKLNLENLEAILNIRFTVLVNYQESIEEMIKKIHHQHGDFFIYDGNITEEHFPLENNSKIKKQKLSFMIFEISQDTSSIDIEKQMKDQGLRPATLKELLAFGEKYPGKQKEFSIVALGSSWANVDEYNVDNIPCLEKDESLRLVWSEGKLYKGYRFLAVRG